MPRHYTQGPMSPYYEPELPPPNEFMGVVGLEGFSPMVGKPFEQVRQSRAAGGPSAPTRRMSTALEPYFALQTERERAFRDLMSGAAQERGTEQELTHYFQDLRGRDTAAEQREHELEMQKEKSLGNLMSILQREELTRTRPKTPPARTPAGAAKEVAQAIKAQLPDLALDDPERFNEIVNKAIEITRRGGEYRLTPSPEMAEPGFLGGLLGRKPSPTGETEWDVEEVQRGEAGPAGAQEVPTISLEELSELLKQRGFVQ